MEEPTSLRSLGTHCRPTPGLGVGLVRKGRETCWLNS